MYHGVAGILVDDLWGEGTEEIALGRNCTVELRDLEGHLLKRIPTAFGCNTSLALLRKPSGLDEPRLLAGRFGGKFGHANNARLSVINDHRENLTNNAYSYTISGATDMTGASSRGTSHLAATDLDGDGSDEVIIARSGHWNELAVLTGSNIGDLGTSECLWIASFGPAAKWAQFITGLAITDIDNDKKKELTVGMANGWLCMFAADGEPLWQRHFPNGVTALAAVGSRLCVGDGSETLHLLLSSGKTITTAKMSGSVSVLESVKLMEWPHARVLAGTSTGQLSSFSVVDN